MDLSPAEIIEGLMKLSIKLDTDMRFEEGAIVSSALAYIISSQKEIDRLLHPSNHKMTMNEEIKTIAQFMHDSYKRDIL